MPPGDLTERARAAFDKQSAYGPDLDLAAYPQRAGKHNRVSSLGGLPPEQGRLAAAVGMDLAARCRAGSFFQLDQSVLFTSAGSEGLEVMAMAEALEKYKWLDEYLWKAVPVDADKYTAHSSLNPSEGYFVRALPGAKVEFPLQACLLMGRKGGLQNVHNIIIAEEGSELHIITGCASAMADATTPPGLHIGVTEFYVKRGATLSYTMVHQWGSEVAVRPRSAAVVVDSGVFTNNYICMSPVASLQACPVAYLKGENSTARFNSVLLCPEGSDLDVGAAVELQGKGSRAEVISRAISSGGTIAARGRLLGAGPEIKAHLECRGLMLSDRGSILAVPELEGRLSGVELSHEAAVGRIAREEINYLMARGLSEGEATSAIVSGFLDIEIKGLPPDLERTIKETIAMALEKSSM